MANNIKNENFITIQGWMVNELNLKGNELMVYAIIYGFSQLDNTKFTGSLQYLCNWTNSSKQGILKNIKSLLEKGLLEKYTNEIKGVKFCEYRAIVPCFNKNNGGMQQSLIPPCNKVEYPYATKFNTPMQQSLPNNIDYNINNNISSSKDDEVINTILNFSKECNVKLTKRTITSLIKTFKKDEIKKAITTMSVLDNIDNPNKYIVAILNNKNAAKNNVVQANNRFNNYKQRNYSNDQLDSMEQQLNRIHQNVNIDNMTEEDLRSGFVK